MADYIELEIETDPDELAQEAYDYLAATIDGWTAADTNIETILIAAVARIASEVRDTAAQIPLAIFRYLGESLHGIAPVEDVAAVATVTFTVKDNAGYTIPEQTTISMTLTDGTELGFETVEELEIPALSTTGTVQVVAVEPGEDGNAATGPELVDALEFVTGVALTSGPSEGSTAETDEEYLSRLATELQLLAPRPILARDFAILALRVTGVGRATALDGYNPGDDTYENERMVAVAVTDAAGGTLSSGVKTEVEELLEELREVNFVVNVMDPDYTDLKVNFEITIDEDYDADETVLAAREAVADYLDPATWGIPPGANGTILEWRNRQTVALYELVTVLNNVEGVDEVKLLQLAEESDTLGTADVTLTGAATLPRITDFDTYVTGAVYVP